MARGPLRVGLLLALLPVVAGAQSAPTAEQRVTELSQEVQELKAVVRQLQEQMARLLQANESPAATPAPTIAPPPAGIATTATPGTAPTAAPAAAPAPGATEVLHGITVNALLDGYYE
jgi:hypothetical protein